MPDDGLPGGKADCAAHPGDARGSGGCRPAWTFDAAGGSGRELDPRLVAVAETVLQVLPSLASLSVTYSDGVVVHATCGRTPALEEPRPEAPPPDGQEPRVVGLAFSPGQGSGSSIGVAGREPPHEEVARIERLRTTGEITAIEALRRLRLAI